MSASEEENSMQLTHFNIPPDITNKIQSPPESYLQSLGLIVNRVRSEHCTEAKSCKNGSLNDFSMVENDDDASFVVLDKESMDSIRASSLASYIDIKQKSVSVDVDSILSSLSSSEIQEKVSVLIQDNIKLKETLKQNTTALKDQFNTLATWQEERLKIHQIQRQKLAEIKDLITHLRKENAELKQKIDRQDQCFKVTDCNNRGPETSEETNKPLNEVKLNRALSLSEEQNNAKQLSLEIPKYLAWLKTVISELREDSFTIQEEISSTNVFRDQSVEGSNFSCIDRPPSDGADIPSPIDRSSLNECGASVHSKALLSQISNNKDNVFHCEKDILKDSTSFLESLKMTIVAERKSLDEEKKVLEKEKRSLEANQKSLITERRLLQQEKINLNEEKASLDHQSELYKSYEDDLQSQKKAFQKQCDELTGEINTLREQLNAKHADFINVLKQMEQQKLTNELLQQQLKIFEEDFNQERQAKHEIINDRSTLQEQLNKQIEINQQCQKEISDLRQVLAGSMSAGDLSRTRSTLLSAERTDDTVASAGLYLCPKCSYSFESVKRLQEHVEQCLDLD